MLEDVIENDGVVDSCLDLVERTDDLGTASLARKPRPRASGTAAARKKVRARTGPAPRGSNPVAPGRSSRAASGSMSNRNVAC